LERLEKEPEEVRQPRVKKKIGEQSVSKPGRLLCRGKKATTKEKQRFCEVMKRLTRSKKTKNEEE